MSGHHLLSRKNNVVGVSQEVNSRKSAWVGEGKIHAQKGK